MNTSPTSRWLRIAWLSCSIFTYPAYSQVEIQWITSTVGPPKLPKLTRGQTLAIAKPTSVRVVVTGVNDILYDHKIKLTLIPKAFNDAGNLDTFKAAGGHASNKDACEALVPLKKEFDEAYNSFRMQQQSAGEKYIPLDTTIGTVDNVIAKLKVLQEDKLYTNGNCRTPVERSADSAIGEKMTQLKSLPHSVGADVVVDPAFDLEIEVAAYVNGDSGPKQVGDTFTVTVGTFTNQLSLSLGVLATTLEARTYSSRNSVVDGALASNRLIVENRGVRPTGVALLNYALWGTAGSPAQDKFGLSLSAGPTVGLGQAGESSAFGFFGGLTFRLWDRLFLTPGAHIGQFADFPAGLQNGSTIPANYGALTPVNRWATRFGLAISFRTNDFSAVRKATPTTGSTAVK